jgi:hypothetical protein
VDLSLLSEGKSLSSPETRRRYSRLIERAEPHDYVCVEPAITRSIAITGVSKTKTGEFAMIKASKIAIAIAVACPVAVAAVGESFATPVPSGAVGVKAAAPVASDVQYRAYGCGPYGCRPYATYRYPYGGHTYWYWYPSYPYWDDNTWNTGNGYY